MGFITLKTILRDLIDIYPQLFNLRNNKILIMNLYHKFFYGLNTLTLHLFLNITTIKLYCRAFILLNLDILKLILGNLKYFT
jgi:hypothetical protein